MLRNLTIVWTSFKMALEELRSNKLRTFLSLLGITFGIFCIISVLSTISSMKLAVQNEIKALGNKTIYIDKWQYGGGPDYPWWKYIKRPIPRYDEMKELRLKVPDAANIAYNTHLTSSIDFEDNSLSGVMNYGITEDFKNIQPLVIEDGRYFQQVDFDRNANFIVMGYTIAEKLFDKAAKAVGKQVKLQGGRVGIVIGVIKKQGQSLIGGWDYDNAILVPYGFLRGMIKDDNAYPTILVQAGPHMPIEALKDELKGAMRSLRKLNPTQEDNFALNDIDTLSNFLNPVFAGMNIGGWAIAALSLIVGMFGVANIMFVTVRERTSQIGLKKAIGAKRGVIMTEFLLESAFLCIIGGLIGLLAVFILTQIISSLFSFKVFIPADIILMAVGICLFTGIVAGIVPAFIAARMDPVVAIRSK
ncbi:MAG: ABC transporter permease [Puia sp.]|nr:ABC transporter permease [Puia sp.]